MCVGNLWYVPPLQFWAMENVKFRWILQRMDVLDKNYETMAMRFRSYVYVEKTVNE